MRKQSFILIAVLFLLNSLGMTIDATALDARLPGAIGISLFGWGNPIHGSGTLLNNQWVLTAKHCITSINNYENKTFALSVDSQIQDVVEIILGDGDFALLRANKAFWINGSKEGYLRGISHDGIPQDAIGFLAFGGYGPGEYRTINVFSFPGKFNNILYLGDGEPPQHGDSGAAYIYRGKLRFTFDSKKNSNKICGIHNMGLQNGVATATPSNEFALWAELSMINFAISIPELNEIYGVDYCLSIEEDTALITAEPCGDSNKSQRWRMIFDRELPQLISVANNRMEGQSMVPSYHQINNTIVSKVVIHLPYLESHHKDIGQLSFWPNVGTIPGIIYSNDISQIACMKYNKYAKKYVLSTYSINDIDGKICNFIMHDTTNEY